MGTGFGDRPDRGRRGRRSRPDDSYDDAYDDDDALEALDEQLRGELRLSLTDTGDPRVVFEELRPRLERARRRRQAGQALVAVAGVTLVAAGLGVALNRSGAPTDRIVSGPADMAQSTIDASTSTDPDRPGLPATSGEADSAPDDPGTTADGQPGPESTTATTADPTSTSGPTTTADSSSTVTTLPSSEEPVTIDSRCGSIVVGVEAGRVELLEVIVGDAGPADVKSSGPTEIEVSFEGNGLHCELKARMKDGQLSTEVEDE